ncbi:hypothetical protein M0R04_08750 [Candidatus Dojkabacteria bacterium]|jgi:hypothetical protein|nr:hypothetical protein [Candidatus Dojkabacteria bacterium]
MEEKTDEEKRNERNKMRQEERTKFKFVRVSRLLHQKLVSMKEISERGHKDNLEEVIWKLFDKAYRLDHIGEHKDGEII